jgi:thiamine-monophosphate kinase
VVLELKPGELNLSSLRALGELRIISILESALGTSALTVVGFGDDISAVRLGKKQVAVLKTDMLVGSTDIPPGMTMKQAAHKAVVANVSDLAAKGIRPLAGIVALGLPAHLTNLDVHQIASGLAQAAKEYGFPLVGGDTNESNDMTISIALFALADGRRLILRSGANVGDIVAVTGSFGNTAAGLKALLEKKKRPEQLPQPLYQAVYNPRAQLDLGLRLAASGGVTASIDSSDGLAWSLHELSKASRMGIRLDTIPVSRAAERFAELYDYRKNDLALYGGEEYHLVVTVRPGKFEATWRTAKRTLDPIGVVTRDFRGVRLRQDGKEIVIARKGWEHFKRSP